MLGAAASTAASERPGYCGKEIDGVLAWTVSEGRRTCSTAARRAAGSACRATTGSLARSPNDGKGSARRREPGQGLWGWPNASPARQIRGGAATGRRLSTARRLHIGEWSRMTVRCCCGGPGDGARGRSRLAEPEGTRLSRSVRGDEVVLQPSVRAGRGAPGRGDARRDGSKQRTLRPKKCRLAGVII